MKNYWIFHTDLFSVVTVAAIYRSPHKGKCGRFNFLLQVLFLLNVYNVGVKQLFRLESELRQTSLGREY
jgi:hypothetical protein